MKPLDLLNLTQESWRPIEPDSGRVSNRTCERELERIPATLIAGPCNAPVKLWDFSPFGFAFIYHHAPDNALRVKAGDAVAVKFDVGGAILGADCLVENTSLFKGNLRIGLSRGDLMKPLAMPGQGNLEVNSKVSITADVPNPLLYGEWSSVALTAVCPGLRLAFVSRDPALLLFLGLEVAVELALPTAGDNVYRGRIAALGRHGEDGVAFLLEPIQVSSKLANELGELLAFEAGVTAETLKSLGFPTRFFRDRLDFRFAETPEEHARALELRRRAASGSWSPAEKAVSEETAAKTGRRGRILCAWHGETLAAAATLGFPDSERAPLKCQKEFPGGVIPARLPERTDLIEITDLCLHPDYHRADLFHALLERVGRALALSERNHAVMLVDDGLAPLYRRAGFRDTAAACDIFGRKHVLLDLSKITVLTGKHMDFFAWCLLFGDLAENLLSVGMLDLPPIRLVLARIRLRLKPWAARLIAGRMETLFKNLLDGRRHAEPAAEADANKGRN